MKQLIRIFFIAACFLMTFQAQAEVSHKGKKSFGLGGLGFYELSSYESLYVNFPTSGLRAAGGGFHAYFEYGLADEFTLSVEAGYSRMTYMNKFRLQSKENFFLIDALGHYYIDVSEKIQPYVAFGVGGIISGSSAAPALDVGFGSHFYVSKNVSIRAQVLYKTAVIHHRGEGSLGVAFHF